MKQKRKYVRERKSVNGLNKGGGEGGRVESLYF